MKRATLPPPPHRGGDCDAKQLDYEAQRLSQGERKTGMGGISHMGERYPTADKHKAVMSAHTPLADATAFFMPYVRMV